MKRINLDRDWTFRWGFLDSVGLLDSVQGKKVNLPHDAMIETQVSSEAEAAYDSGYYKGCTCNYTRFMDIPEDWSGDCVGLKFDGAMMHISIDVNGCKVFEHHYGYSPFYVDITDYVTFGKENRITVNANSGIQPSSRWYTGCGLFRGVELCHGPKIHIPTDGIYLRTLEVSEGIAFLEGQIDICNRSSENHLVRVSISLSEDVIFSRVIQVNSKATETAVITMNLKNPKLWNVDVPNLYNVRVTAKDLGEFRTHLIENPKGSIDEDTAIFGIRTITADSVRGLRINGRTVKLKGGCLHHDNGLLGSISLYESEERKVRKLKEVGFNAIRTAHNPPSSALVEACDRVGMYIFDEAFDSWGMSKRVGDYSQHFEKYWREDLTAFVRRDRIHPSVIMWSTGNEIPERGGLNNGYALASRIAKVVKELDSDRPVSNGICSFWSGLDDERAIGQNSSQNAKDESNTDFWEKGTEPFTNGLDVVGYNYMEELYERDHELYPERVILGSENFPKEIGYRWPLVERLPYVIGDFTWTCWDYIGEAGIGKALYIDKDDPASKKQPWDIMPPSTSPYPWRLANDADFDITGRLLPQGAYRSVVWGSRKTYLYSYTPEQFGKVELMSMWGFPGVKKNWNFDGEEGKPIELLVFSNSDEVELRINGEFLERKKVSFEKPLPNSVRFNTVYRPGIIEAISYCEGKEISRDSMETSGEAVKLKLTAEKTELRADGHDAVYVDIEALDEEGRPVSNAEISLTAELICTKAGERADGNSACAFLAGFGTGNPKTEENYTENSTLTYYGRACAIIRSTYEVGEAVLKVSGEGFESEVKLNVVL